jgi:NAD(P)-dependent dehydrogenase (short-subunit alcohol dehydrogenase family)
MQMSTWLITGCSSGLGRSIANAVLACGHNAVVTARRTESVQDIVEAHPATARAVSLEVSDPVRVAAAVATGEQAFGGVDVLVNNAGHGYRAAVEEADDGDVAELFATNFFGPVSLIKAVLPGMRQRRRGAIVNISSIAGRRAAAGSGFYAASKFALEGMSDGLRKEVEPLGIRVVLVEPGAFRTDFAGRSLQQSSTVIEDYAQTAAKRRKENDTTHGTQIGDPDRAARAILEAVETPDGPFRLALGSDAVSIIGDELDAQRAELDAWRSLSLTTDFPA